MTHTTATEGQRHRHNGQPDLDVVNDLLGTVGEPDDPTGRPQRQTVPAHRQKVAPPAVSYRRISSAELDANTYALEYLIDNVLVAHQPCILAGSKKTLKTSLLIDLGISLAMGGCFLGRLRVNRACRVGIMTGESGLATIQETARRVCAAAGYRLGDIGGLVWSDQLPQFGSLPHQDALRKWITDDELEVLAVDPCYMCIPDAEHGNIFDMGPKLRGVSEVCQDTGAMLILAHHNRKTGKADPYSPPELEDIAWSGFQEFARQWLLIGRRQPYQPGTGEHKLWLSAGGSAGHSDLWAVDIAEGKRTDPDGRKWEVELLSASEARERAAAASEDRKAQSAESKATARLDSDRARVVKALAKGPDTTKGIRQTTGLRGERLDTAIAALLQDGDIVPAEIVKPNRLTPYEGFALKVEV